MNYFLDTNICSYFLKGMYEELLYKIKLCQTNQIKIPSIVKAELLYGANKGNNPVDTKLKINKFLLPFEIISFGDNESIIYSEIRAHLEKKGKVIGPNDLIIAATVLANNGILITNNEKEFKNIINIKIQNWTK
ncbi:MAG: nucleic acid-binding protein [Spirochaetes bacterium GWF1_41_5]|nr:MAG: nucleic acid-binding protein [Spirochaetes bacterium GWF1_41_5]